MEAANEYDLARALRQDGYILISAESQKQPSRKFNISLPFLSQVSFREKMMLARNLKVMLGAGVALPKALKTLSLQAGSKKLARALLDIAEEIAKGENFSAALRKYPDIFSEIFCSMVMVGEESGTLENNLDLLAKQMEREQELRSKIQSALLYPAVIIAAMIGIGIMMLVTVVPKLADTFKDLEIELPLTTKFVIFLGTALAEKWYLAIIIFIIFLFLIRLAFHTKFGRKIMGTASLKIPIISVLTKKTNSAHTVRTLSFLIAAGIPLVRSLEIVSQTIGNIYYQMAIRQAIEEVKKGSKLSEALKKYHDIYSLTVIQMIEVGEETGETAAVLEKLGSFFEEEVATATKDLASIIEPIIMLVIGGAVGFFAISMIQPMYSMLSGIK